MKSKFLYILIALIPFTGLAQNKIQWSDDYELSKSDFQAKAPNTGTMQTVSGSFFVEYEIGGLNLISTRNLNKNVSCYFQKNASYFDDGDVASVKRLLRYQQLIFNLYELQARKLRQKFFEERQRLLLKGPATLWEEVSAEHVKIIAKVENETNHGYVSSEITKWETWTNKELEKLEEFCKTCKPKKKKKDK
ncbi:MAG: hypothetical protein ABFS16_00435 [Bacteroidota bacterium]